MTLIDPAHQALSIFEQEITRAVWDDKYRYGGEESPEQSLGRVAEALCRNDNPDTFVELLDLQNQGLIMLAGRIQAGAGTQKHVTLVNCYVMQNIPDDMAGIGDTLKHSMLTMQQGGGIGLNFSTLRPTPAILLRTGSVASGPLPFMSMWDSMCKTIMSSGARRGAMMAVLHCTHPNLPQFIEAKHKKNTLTNFNMSILVTDEFIKAVRSGLTWDLGFHKRPLNDEFIEVKQVDGKDWYVYSRWNASDLWNLIVQSTYDYSEPGVIFIDRINQWNNLSYCEKITAVNPCGEQPLPPFGACLLGSINLARLVQQPFTTRASFDYKLFSRCIHSAVRALDNALDISIYPLPQQEEEAKNKRRIGLGISGLANMLAELQISYNHPRAIEVTKQVMSILKDNAYEASINLAKERGSFPAFDSKKFLQQPFIKKLNSKLRAAIKKNGIRNGVLLTIAPTGTTSIYFGNISSGLEPVYQFEGKRFILQPDGERKEFPNVDYGWRLFHSIHKSPTNIPDYLMTADQLVVEDHLRIQSICQNHIDAAISKTINCPESITFEQFREVYFRAYELGCKGCTTYRPSETRGSIFSSEAASVYDPSQVRDRPAILSGKTYKLYWPPNEATFYVTINDDGAARPFEIFISSTHAQYTEWTTALTLMITAILRRGGDVSFIAENLKQIVSATSSAWVKGKYCNSLVAMIGETIELHMNRESAVIEAAPVEKSVDALLSFCPRCGQKALIHSEGCGSCQNCGYSNCG